MLLMLLIITFSIITIISGCESLAEGSVEKLRSWTTNMIHHDALVCKDNPTFSQFRGIDKKCVYALAVEFVRDSCTLASTVRKLPVSLGLANNGATR